MKFANIVPIPFLNAYQNRTCSDYHLALTHLVGDENYVKFMRRRSIDGDFIIMDNSLIELGSAMRMTDVLDAAIKCNANEIVLRDVFRDRRETLRAIVQSIDELQHSGYSGPKKFRYMAVPQGDDFNDWLNCLQYILENIPQVNTIGIPKVTNTFFPYTDKGRVNVLEYLEKYSLPQAYPQIQWHMLGVWNNPIELKYAAPFTWVRGCDSSIAWACGNIGIAFHEELGMLIDRPEEAKIDFSDTHEMFKEIIQRNVDMMYHWATPRSTSEVF